MVTAGVLTRSGSVGLAADSYPTSPKTIQATPAVGGLTAIVRVHFVADGYEGTYGPDNLEVTGPAGTSCAGDLIDYGDVIGPHQDASGPVTLYIGPSASWQYPLAANTFDIGHIDPNVDSEQPLTRWCPGTYTGTAGFLGPGGINDNFQFTIVTNRAAKLPMAVAEHLRAVTVKPYRGGRRAVFAVRYRADSISYDSGDVVEVYGPKQSACRGSVLRAAAGGSHKRSGPLTLRVGPGAADRPYGDNGLGEPLQRWCSGTYKGTIFYEHGPKFTVIGRFKFTVDP